MPNAERRRDEDRAALEQMSTAGLEELLRRDFHAPEDEKTDENRLYHAAQILAGRAPEVQADADRAWDRFRKKYLPFAKVRSARYEDGVPPSSYAAPERRHSRWQRWGVHGAAAALAILLSVSAAAAGAGGMEGLRALWTGEKLWIGPGQVKPAGRNEIQVPEGLEECTDLQEALEACGLTLPVAPGWLPDGFELDGLVIDDWSSPSCVVFSALYCRGEDNLVMQMNIFTDIGEDESHTGANFEKDKGAPVPYEAGGVTHLLSTNDGRPFAVWVNGPAECSVTGDITMEELEQMIDSIYR